MQTCRQGVARPPARADLRQGRRNELPTPAGRTGHTGFTCNDQTRDLLGRVREFIESRVCPNQEACCEQPEQGDSRWKDTPVLEALKE